MKPQNEHFMKINCPAWIESAKNNFQEAVNQQTKNKTSATDLYSQIDESEVMASSPNKKFRTNEKNVMNPDDYFKGLICRTLKMDVKNLHEPYFKKFLNQRKYNVQKIMEAKERKELKFCKELLKMKHKEIALKSGIEKDQGELKLNVQTDVAYRIYKKAYEDNPAAPKKSVSLSTRNRNVKSATRDSKKVEFSKKVETIPNVKNPIFESPISTRKASYNFSNAKSVVMSPLDPLKYEQENKRVKK